MTTSEIQIGQGYQHMDLAAVLVAPPRSACGLGKAKPRSRQGLLKVLGVGDHQVHALAAIGPEPYTTEASALPAAQVQLAHLTEVLLSSLRLYLTLNVPQAKVLKDRQRQ